jgi:hypothetical protein
MSRSLHCLRACEALLAGTTASQFRTFLVGALCNGPAQQTQFALQVGDLGTKEMVPSEGFDLTV